MAGRFEIRAAAAVSLVRLTMSGFFEPDEINRLGEDMAKAIASLRCAPNSHITLVDIRDMAIQSRDAVDDFTKLVGSEAVRSRKLAFVTARSLALHQARRLTDRCDVELFETLEAAEAWLGLSVARPAAARA